MRLRKTMKRTAAAVLALSMAVSAAAMPASAGFNIDMSKVDGDVEITQADDNGSAKVTIMVGGADKTKDFSDGKEGNDVTITGDNTKPTESLNAAEENADEVEKPTEAEKPGENTAEGEGDEPTSQELLAPEDEETKDEQTKTEQKPADSQEPEQDKKTEKTSDQVIEYGQYDAEAQQEATKPAAKQEAGEKKAAEDEDDDDDVMTFEANTADTVTKAVSEAVKNVIKIINNCTKKDTTVTLKDVNIDVSGGQYGTGKAAMSVEGAGDTTLKLEGDNTLKSGWGRAGVEKNDKTSSGKLTITAEDTSSSLNAYGGQEGAGIGGGGYNQSTSKLEIANGKIYAKGGFRGAGIGGGSISGNGEVTISGGEVEAHGEYDAAGIGGSGSGSGKVTIKNGKVTAKTSAWAAAIGGGTDGSGDVTILDGTVNATPVDNRNDNSVTGIGGGPDSTDKSTVRILGGVVNAVGSGYGSGIGGGRGRVDAQVAEVEIGGGAQVTAKGGSGYAGLGAGAAIGTGGELRGKAGKELDVNTSGEATVTRIDSKLSAGHKHTWTLVSSTPAAVGQQGKKVYECSCGSTRTEYEPALPAPAPVEEQNGRNAYAALTVEGAAYEMHQESARYIVTADSDTATLFGSLGNLAELKAQGVDTLVFRTKSRETALDIDTMLSLGAEDTLFTLTHSGSSATLTVGGADHNELIH